MEQQRIRVVTESGLAGTGEPLPGDDRRLLVRFDSGRELVVSIDALEPQRDGSYLMPLSADALDAPGNRVEAVIPVIREELDIKRRFVETGRGIRIRKEVREREELVVQLLYREALDVDRRPVNQIVDRPPEVRYEGETMVIPLCEEVIVVEKRLLLKEEVRVMRRSSQVRQADTIVLRSEVATIEQLSDGAQDDRPPAPVHPASTAS